MNLAVQQRDDFRSQVGDKPHLGENHRLMADVSIGKFIQDLYLKSGFQAKSWYEDYGVS
jgi:hypothetical protein